MYVCMYTCICPIYRTYVCMYVYACVFVAKPLNRWCLCAAALACSLDNLSFSLVTGLPHPHSLTSSLFSLSLALSFSLFLPPSPPLPLPPHTYALPCAHLRYARVKKKRTYACRPHARTGERQAGN